VIIKRLFQLRTPKSILNLPTLKNERYLALQVGPLSNSDIKMFCFEGLVLRTLGTLDVVFSPCYSRWYPFRINQNAVNVSSSLTCCCNAVLLELWIAAVSVTCTTLCPLSAPKNKTRPLSLLRTTEKQQKNARSSQQALCFIDGAAVKRTYGVESTRLDGVGAWPLWQSPYS